MTMTTLVTEFNVAQISDDWEELVSAGQAIAEAHDRNRWALGDLGCKVERRYGESTIAEYASAINIRTSTMYDYTAVSIFYASEEDRVAFPPLNWSHYRIAMRAKSLDIALNWLAKAADNGWKVEDLAEALDPGSGGNPKNEKKAEFGAEYKDLTPILNDANEIIGYTLIFRITDDVEKKITEHLKLRTVYKLKVFGVPEAGGDDDAV